MRQQIERLVIEREMQAILDFSQRPDGASPEWQHKAGIVTTMAVLSPDDAAALKEKWIALLAPYTAAARADAGQRAVTHVLGCHIEMTRRPGRDYPIGSTYQPAEPPLEMTAAQLGEIRAAAASVASKRGIHRFDGFIIYNEPRVRDQLGLMGRGLLHKAYWAVTPRSR